MNGIDVSAYQGFPNWRKAKAAGVEFAILRICNSKGIDSSYKYNLQNCIDNNIPLGVYRYSYALTVDQAVREAQEVITVLGTDTKLEFGVWLDLEWNQQRALGKDKITEIARAWIDIIERAGYKCGIYCNLDWYDRVLDTKALNREYWIARYAGSLNPSLKPNRGEVGWQYSSKGTVNGIEGYVDMNIWYDNVAEPITEPGGNEMGIVTYSRVSHGDIRVASNFKVKEFACRDGSDKILVDKKVVEYLQAARDTFDVPIIINSAYRTPAYNTKVGGAKNSYHVKGMAVDHHTRGKVALMEMAKFYESIGCKGIIVYPNSGFIHIDTRTNKYFAIDKGKISVVDTFMESTKINPYEVPTRLLKRGRTGSDVKWLQFELREAGYNIKVDGIFGGITEAAVKAFQGKYKLVRDGLAGDITVTYLKRY